MTTVSMTTLLLTSLSIMTSTEAQPGTFSVLPPLTTSPGWRTQAHSSRGPPSPPLSQNSLMTQRLATVRRERTPQTRRTSTSSWEATTLSTHELFLKSSSQTVTKLSTSVQQLDSTHPTKMISSTSLPTVGRVSFRFLSLHEDQLLTTAGAMTTRGNVTIEHVTSNHGGYLEPVVMVSSSSAVNLGNTLPCLTEASPCAAGFNLRVTFELNKVGVDPAFILWSGDEVSNMGTMSLYYHNNDFVLHFKSAGIIWNGTFNSTLDPNTWHTVDATWDTRTPPKLFLDNQRINGTVTHKSVSSSTASHPLYLGRSGPADNSTTLKVYGLDLWSTSRSVINKTELRLQTIEDVVHVTAILPQKAVQVKTDCLSSDGFSNITHLNLTFLTANRSVVSTPSLPLPVHGSARLNITTGVLTLRGPNSFVDINASCVPCLADLRQCRHGLSLQMDVLLTSLPLPPGARVHLFGGPNLASDESGIILRYEKDAFKAEVRLGRLLWLLNATTVLTNKKTCRLQLSWSPADSLQLTVDGNLVQVGRQELSSLNAEKPSVLRMGSGSGWRYSNQTVDISHVNIWTGSTAYLREQGVWTADTTTAGHVTTASLAAVIPSFRWIFSSASGPVLTSGGMRAEVKGDPESGPLGLDLVNSGQYVQVRNLRRNLTCLVVTDACQTGVTVGVELMPRALNDGAVIFSSGADSDQAQGLALIYRFGQFHAVVSTKQRTTYVSFKRDLLPSDQVTEVHVGFQLPDVLRVYVMGEMVGPASSQAGTTSTEGLPSGGGTLYLGRSSGVGPAGRPPGYTLTSVTVWLAGPDALEKVGLLSTIVASTSQTHLSVGSIAERTSSVDSATRPDHLTTLATPACGTECGPNRKCVAGACVCDSVVVGDVCSPGHNYSRTGHTTTQLCDLRHEKCDYVILPTSGYVSSQNITCCALYVTDVSDAFQPTSPRVERVAALYSSGGQALCPVRNHRSAWVWGEQPHGAASGDTLLHVVYDSICHICHLHADGVNITCTRRDSCLVEGQCFLRGQQQPDNDCNVCSPDLNPDNWTSTSGKDCMESDAQRNDDRDNRVTVVALGTVCGVLVSVTTVAGVIYFVTRKKTNKQLLTIQETLAKMRTRSFATAFSSHSFIRNGEFPRPDGLANEDMDVDNHVSDIDMLY